MKFWPELLLYPSKKACISNLLYLSDSVASRIEIYLFMNVLINRAKCALLQGKMHAHVKEIEKQKGRRIFHCFYTLASNREHCIGCASAKDEGCLGRGGGFSVLGMGNCNEQPDSYKWQDGNREQRMVPGLYIKAAALAQHSEKSFFKALISSLQRFFSLRRFMRFCDSFIFYICPLFLITTLYSINMM